MLVTPAHVDKVGDIIYMLLWEGEQAAEPVIPVIPLESDKDSLVTLSLSLSLVFCTSLLFSSLFSALSHS